jgi:AcrR family transcriptional regulator
MIQLTRKERDKMVRRTDILRAAEHLFARKGYEGATIQDIAQQAQYGAGTVYLYFKDKESLYYSLIEEKISTMVTIIKEKTSRIEDAGRKLGIFVDEVFDYFEQNQDFFSIFILERGRLQWEMEVHARPAHIEHMPFVTEMVKAGQQQKLLRDDYAPRQMAELLVSMISSVIFDYMKQKPGQKSLKEMSGFVLGLFLNGARKK